MGQGMVGGCSARSVGRAAAELSMAIGGQGALCTICPLMLGNFVADTHVMQIVQSV